MVRCNSVPIVACLMAGHMATHAYAAGPCEPSWIPAFHGGPGVSWGVYSLSVHDAPDGPALYIAGNILSAGGLSTSGVAAWNGSPGPGGWTTFGQSIAGQVHAIALYSDGSGPQPQLYIGGRFDQLDGTRVNHIAKWDGVQWVGLRQGMPYGDETGKQVFGVQALAVYDDGRGEALYAGGNFSRAAEWTIDFIAKWDGQTWSPVGASTPGPVHCLEVFDDGRGPALYAGGGYPPGFGGGFVAQWDGTTWVPITLTDGPVYTIETIDDGGGPALFIGGAFTTPFNRIAKYTPNRGAGEWTGLGEGLGPGCSSFSCVNHCGRQAPGGCWCDETCCWFLDCCYDQMLVCFPCFPYSGGPTCAVHAIAMFDDGCGSGPLIHAAGFFPTSPVDVKRLARWTGVAWEYLNSEPDGDIGVTLHALAIYQLSGAPPSLFVGGHFTSSPAGDSYVARLQGCRSAACAPADITCDGFVGVADLLEVLEWWGDCEAPPRECTADIAPAGGDGVVNVMDLLALLNHWGVCP